MQVGILALQGCITPHIEIFDTLGVKTQRVRSKEELASINRIVLPGGESSTMLKLLKKNNLFDDLKEFCKTNPCWGICAGSILLASQVTHPEQDSLATLPVRAHRNFYGSQLDSFNAEIEIAKLGDPSMKVQFIRAPKLTPLNDQIEILATHEQTPVAIQSEKCLITSFHTELTEDARLHQYFLNL